MFKAMCSVYFIIKSYAREVEYVEYLLLDWLTGFAYFYCLPIENTNNTKCPSVYKMEVKRTRIFM